MMMIIVIIITIIINYLNSHTGNCAHASRSPNISAQVYHEE